MNLKEYYENLPERTTPKTELIEKIAELCKVKQVTVRTWVKGRSIPSDPKHREIIATLVGKPIDELFKIAR